MYVYVYTIYWANKCTEFYNCPPSRLLYTNEHANWYDYQWTYRGLSWLARGALVLNKLKKEEKKGKEISSWFQWLF